MPSHECFAQMLAFCRQRPGSCLCVCVFVCLCVCRALVVHKMFPHSSDATRIWQNHLQRPGSEAVSAPWGKKLRQLLFFPKTWSKHRWSGRRVSRSVRHVAEELTDFLFHPKQLLSFRCGRRQVDIQTTPTAFPSIGFNVVLMCQSGQHLLCCGFSNKAEKQW